MPQDGQQGNWLKNKLGTKASDIETSIPLTTDIAKQLVNLGEGEIEFPKLSTPTGQKGSTLTKSLIPVATTGAVLGFNKFAQAQDKTPYERISRAETGNEKDPWIRTKAYGSGSSAFGEAQITKGLVDSVLKDSKKYNFDKEDISFLTWLSQQQGKMLKYGGKDMIKGMERYDYGQKGDWQDSLIPKYRKAIGKVINVMSKQHGNRFWKVWRFGEKGSKIKTDKRYEREYNK
ncbi:hypothetical protein M0R04_11930 [Candidatus Dojkabacteria bacterium]|jgi:hypothetical protein|nr:hypothetical protein [Candidatus Dojkabacteria bacterium]